MEKLKTKLCTEDVIDQSLEEKELEENQNFDPLIKF